MFRLFIRHFFASAIKKIKYEIAAEAGENKKRKKSQAKIVVFAAGDSVAFFLLNFIIGAVHSLFLLFSFLNLVCTVISFEETAL